MAMKPLKVNEVNSFIKKLIYSNPLLNNISIVGEVVDLKKSFKNIIFFNLKGDNEEIIRCICFDSSLEVEEGKETVISGKVDTYPQNSVYQIIVRKAETLKDGESYNKLEKLKEKLFKKGYFDPSKKKKLPKFPQNIGIITSVNSAAVKDILNVLNSYKLGLNINIYDSGVQGSSAVDKIVKGIEYFNDREVDVVLISRGGGSKMDLEVFNDERIADYIYKSKKPVVCGIGHEIDTYIADLTADAYAITPTGAAKLIIENYITYIDRINFFKDKIIQKTETLIQRKYNYVNLKRNKLLLLSPYKKISSKINYLDRLENRMSTAVSEVVNEKNKRIETLRYKLSKYDYKNIFNKGFVFIKDENSNIINSVEKINYTDKYYVQFIDGIKTVVFIEDKE
jgi:exodeoxyribonuclease VII large subunit